MSTGWQGGKQEDVCELAQRELAIQVTVGDAIRRGRHALVGAHGQGAGQVFGRGFGHGDLRGAPGHDSALQTRPVQILILKSVPMTKYAAYICMANPRTPKLSVMNTQPITLNPGQHWSPRDAWFRRRALTLRCHRGTLWITGGGVAGDHLLRAAHVHLLLLYAPLRPVLLLPLHFGTVSGLPAWLNSQKLRL